MHDTLHISIHSICEGGVSSLIHISYDNESVGENAKDRSSNSNS